MSFNGRAPSSIRRRAILPDAQAQAAINPFMIDYPRRSDRHLEILAGAEGDLFAGLDVDRLTGHRIATHAGSTTAHQQDPEPDELYPLAPLQVLGDHAHQVLQYFKGLLLGELMLLRQLIGQMLDRDRLRCRLGCHYWVSHGRLLPVRSAPRMRGGLSKPLIALA